MGAVWLTQLETLDDIGQGRIGFRPRRTLDVHQQETRDDRNVTHAIREEAPALADPSGRDTDWEPVPYSDVSIRGTCQSLRPEAPLEGRIVRLEPIAEAPPDGLREAAEREWHIHRFTNMATFGFDRWFDLALESEREVPFVVLVGRARRSARRAT